MEEAPQVGRAPTAAPSHRGLILAVLCSAQVILAVDVTVVNVASSSIERALGFTAANLEWTITAYSLTFGGFLLLGGRMSDLYGRRRLFLLGIGAFALASLGAGLAENSAELIGARAAQGLCAAVVSPAVLSLLAATFPEGHLRQRAYGMWATAGSIGGLTGFFFGGVIVSALGWRWIFFINIPIAALALTGASLLLHPVEEPLRRRRLDVPGAVTVTSALALVIFGLGEAQSNGWTGGDTLGALLAAPLLLAAFALVERRAAEPLLPFALLRRRAAVGNVLSVLQQSIGAATAFLAPLYMQQVWHYSAWHAGAATLPLPVGFGLASRVSSRLGPRLGVRGTVVLGFSLATAGLAWLTLTPLHPDYAASFLPALFVRGFGQGLVVVQAVGVATSGVRREDQGIAAGLYNMSQQLGGALGLAAIVTIASAAAVGGGLSGEAHGIRFALGVSAGVGLAAVLISLTALQAPANAPASAPPPPVAGRRRPTTARPST
ncbi:MAG TPA: MFS transporter [Acidimicrobiales bacterium]|nr:MFS transporter [Acidimicrobiales bacterium]